MAQFIKTKGMVITLFLIPALANAATTISYLDRDFVVRDLPIVSGTDAYYILDIGIFSGLYKSRLTAIAKEFNKPPVRFTSSTHLNDTNAHSIKSLPPVPGTLMMVLVGFLCISLVKDRKIWLAAFAGLLWAGQTGFAVLPQFALHVVGKRQNEQNLSYDITNLCVSGYFNRHRCDIEGTSYIGLLRHLDGIPGGSVRFLPCITVRDKIKQESPKIITKIYCERGYSYKSALSLCHFKALALFEGNSYPTNHYFSNGPHIARMRILSLIRKTDCLAPRAEQPVYVALAFILANLTRGPPRLI